MKAKKSSPQYIVLWENEFSIADTLPEAANTAQAPDGFYSVYQLGKEIDGNTINKALQEFRIEKAKVELKKAREHVAELEKLSKGIESTKQRSHKIDRKKKFRCLSSGVLKDGGTVHFLTTHGDFYVPSERSAKLHPKNNPRPGCVYCASDFKVRAPRWISRRILKRSGIE